eukprot:CAMPEP_0184483236 /NCGR_PEP_ID=MMETSP0113_2-20130426/4884_1 /TAXON_ID=91329 /ORGANISM="Norrisiella sphaerica, Strain BC52" /LENGTH=206 /DNA_ID=CAMNT_0026863515 /DNA_START=161 /DNA_END=781 /DNA_ORIENTATION=-
MVMLTSSIAWSDDEGQVGLYATHFALGLEGYKFSFKCKEGEVCPNDNHSESDSYTSQSCRWKFCEPCALASEKIRNLTKMCLAFIGTFIVATLIRAKIMNRGGFFGKLLGVITAALTLVTMTCTWIVWVKKCANQFDGLSYMVGHIRVVGVKPQLYYGFVIAIMGSAASLLTVITEAARKTTGFGANPPGRNRVEGINYHIVLGDT